MKGNITSKEIQHIRKHIGLQLKEAREKKGLTQQELSDEMGIRQPTVASVERGEWAVSIDKLQLFCKHLGLKISLKESQVVIQEQPK
jgi:transcriptional regulator with XRE-family HTH domain